jgi:hypothetical protein
MCLRSDPSSSRTAQPRPLREAIVILEVSLH